MKEHYILQFPFTSAAGNTIDSLQLRRLKVKDMRNARRISEKPEEWDEPLMAAMTGLVPEDLAEMDLLDYQALQKRFQSMLTVVTESSPAMAGNGATG
ncbi:TPA: phage tail assembly protein, partial [Escherichia coli]|nr:phage tail assembly protein [Escherichia coli]